MDELRGRGLSGVWHHTGVWNTTALDPGTWYNTTLSSSVYTVYKREKGCRFMVTWWVKEEEKAPENRQGKRGKEGVDKVEVEVAPGVAVRSSKRFKAALIGPTQGLTKRRRLCRQAKA